ncbi:MAG: hypothetical protein ACK5WF_09065, partial [Cyclobacteriaceae bacterium]
TSEEYRALFSECLNIVKLYHTPYWISDIRNQGVVSADDQRWMLQTIYPEANKNGLVQTALIYNPQNFSTEYMARIQAAADGLGINLQFFDNRKDADAWIQTSFENSSAD